MYLFLYLFLYLSFSVSVRAFVYAFDLRRLYHKLFSLLVIPRRCTCLIPYVVPE